MANFNDIAQTLARVGGVPPVAGRLGRPRRRPDALPSDKGYNSKANRRESRKRRILPVISADEPRNIRDLGKLRYVVEQTFSPLHHVKCLAVLWKRRTELRDAFVPWPAHSSGGDASTSPIHDRRSKPCWHTLL
ncbi:hypothetical protein [Streptomyces sp. NPDC051572]|uniref:hypothetical protein n=1 Tax=Streptomyces sp. NPDC051572 TaxID=3155802 RepID=UPI00344C0A1E